MNKKLIWYIKAQAGVLLFPLGLCLFGEAVIHKGSGQPWFWLGTLSLIVINTGIGLMIESGLISGFPRGESGEQQAEATELKAHR
ncbi:MAG: hypothetical protein HC881_23420 [Leptolyngbyaceae cyanobacterium SL_7_1]|nr:hypothetical protein [Leptolyngbyaceae cyanobacterium SL_7_1]